jgi:hypothetical protein
MSNARPRLQAAGELGRQDFGQEQPRSQLRDLFAPLDRLLISGGDARLVLDRVSGRNSYGCQPSPAPDVLSFSSSTASSISQRAYDRAAEARDSLMREVIARGLHDAFDGRIEEMRDELTEHLGLSGKGVEVVFSASGTDSQLHSLFLARSLFGTPLTTIVVAADQTGSGTVHTARGRHFSDKTASGVQVRKGEPVEGLADCLSSVELSPMNDDGELRSQAEIDFIVLDAVERALAGGGKVLLQVMDSSKLGWRLPSDQCVDEISQRWADSVQIVVDACQMRVGRRRLGAYLERGYIVLMTGSKFFTGPPFSGAVLVPKKVAHAIGSIDRVPAGLFDYSARSDWPKRWRAVRSHFPVRRNFGQWLRWEAALEEIAAYYRVPEAFRRSAIAELGAGIALSLRSSSSLQLLSLRGAAPSSVDEEEFSSTTIFPFTIEKNGRTFKPSASRAVYRRLSGNEPDLDRPECLIGQPVELLGANQSRRAALRMCVDARHVIDAWSPDPDTARRHLQTEIRRAAAVVANIESLLVRTERHEALVGTNGH